MLPTTSSIERVFGSSGGGVNAGEEEGSFGGSYSMNVVLPQNLQESSIVSAGLPHSVQESVTGAA
jgi:hypothetical protein